MTMVEHFKVAPGFKLLPVEDLGEGITLDSLYPHEEIAAFRAHGLTDDEIWDLHPERAHEILAQPDNEAAPITDRPTFPEPDRNQIEIFVQTMFRYCGPDGIVSLRSFHQNDDSKRPRITPVSLKDGLTPLIEAAAQQARRAAKGAAPFAFTPPVATFKAEAGWHAREEDLLEGPTLSAELDENPRAALTTLERLLGPATLVVRSGGQWLNPATGELEDKLHAYWRLKEPAKGEEQLGKLKELRRLAHVLVGGDMTNVTIVHPIRWPGSWHRKSTPRLCEIVSTEHIDNEIDLDIALAKLEAVAPLPLINPQVAPEADPPLEENGEARNFEVAEGFKDLPLENLGENITLACIYPPEELAGLHALGLTDGAIEQLTQKQAHELLGIGVSPHADPELIAAALAVIPNSKRLLVLRGEKINGSEDDPLHWKYWNDIGMAIWRGTSGSPEGFAAFDTWSKKSPKYNAKTTAERWAAYAKYPPTKTGARTIFYLAGQASPGWREEYDARKSNGQEERQNAGLPGFDLSQKQSTPLPLRPYTPRPFTQIPRRQWLHAGHYIREQVVMTVAPGGYGKTALILLNAIEMATGRGLIGPAPAGGRLRVLYWNGEDPEDEVERRIAAICIRYDIPPEELEGCLFLGSKITDPQRLATMDRYGNVVLNQAVLAQITQFISNNKIDCSMFDPLIAFHRVKENDTMAMEVVIRNAFEHTADATNSCIELSQHTRKPAPGAEITADDSRGAGGTVFAARSVRVLNRMSKDEAKLPKIEGQERWLYLRVSRDKVNLVPPGKAAWIHLAEITLPNSDGSTPGDKVQAAEAWDYPQPSDDITIDDAFWIRKEARQKEYRTNPRSPDWIGYALAKRLDLDVGKDTLSDQRTNEQKSNRQKVGAILKMWIDNSVLATEERKDKTRREYEYVIPGPWDDDAVADEQAAERAERRKTLEPFAAVLAAWKAAIGVGEQRSLDHVIKMADMRINPELNAAFLAVASMDDGKTISNVLLARWLRDHNNVPIDGLMLSGDSQNKWTLVEDKHRNKQNVPHTPITSAENKKTSAPAPSSTERKALRYADKQIPGMTPEQVAQLAAVLAAWFTTIGIAQPRTVKQVIAAANDGEADGKLKLTLTAVTGQNLDSTQLEEWLRSVSGVEINHLMLRSYSVDEKEAPQWTLELRVEPDKGSPSL
jgi:hypothetical protein